MATLEAGGGTQRQFREEHSTQKVRLRAQRMNTSRSALRTLARVAVHIDCRGLDVGHHLRERPM